jgi:hypothetical protein
MTVCSQAEGSLSIISTALLQNTAAHKNKKFSAFFIRNRKFVTLITTSHYFPPFWASWIRSTFSHSTSFNPLNAELNPICQLLTLLGAHCIHHVSRIRVNTVLFFHLHTVSWRVQSHTFRTIPISPMGATCPPFDNSSFLCSYLIYLIFT